MCGFVSSMGRTQSSGRAPRTHTQSSALLRVEKPSPEPQQDPIREEDGATSHQLSWTLLMDLVTWTLIP